MTDDFDAAALMPVGSEQSKMLVDAYERMSFRRRRAVALGEWYCPARGPKGSCLLLTVWQSPRGRVGVVPSYTLSRALNELESNESGRRANTRDGVNHWNGVGLLIDGGSAVNLTVTCKHYRGRLDMADILAAVDGAKPGSPVPVVVSRSDR